MIPKERVSLWEMCQERAGPLKSLLESRQEEGKTRKHVPKVTRILLTSLDSTLPMVILPSL